MNVTIRKIGNSEGVILPKELLERHHLRAGDRLEIQEIEDALVLKPSTELFERQMEVARKVMDRYKVALQKLAE